MSTDVCVKIGGSTIDMPGILDEFAEAIRRLQSSGRFPLIVHGGGKDIGRQLALLKKQFFFVEGMRVTDAQTMQTVQMVLSGDINKRIVNVLLCHGMTAMGICGIDMGLFTAEKLIVNGRDIGFVGTITRVDTRIIDICRDGGIIPVVSPVSRSAAGEIFNVNADVAAAELAKATRCDRLMLVSDVDGVFIDGAVAHQIRISDIENMAEAKYVTGGMLPKLRSAAEAVRSGVGQVHICGWHGPSTFLQELSPETIRGTVVF